MPRRLKTRPPQLTPESEVPAWWVVLKRAVPVLVSGIVIYTLVPVLTKVVSAWPRLSSLLLDWALVGLAAETASFICTFLLKRVALRTRAIFAVVTSGLVGNAVTNVLPGGDATGAAVEFRMLSGSGVETGTAIGGLTATALLQTGCLLALPMFAIPAILAGAPVSRGLAQLAYLGLGMFVLYIAGGFVIFQTDGPLRLAGRIGEKVRNRIRHRRPPITGLPGRIIAQRNATRSALGDSWWQALLYATGRVVLDFVCLLSMLAATRARPEPWLVLIAYVGTTVLALLPLTPGGLGLVEGSLSGLLVLAGIPGSDAVLSTLAYRVFSYWMPTLAGPIAYIAYQRRYHNKRHRSDQASAAGRASSEQS